MKSILIIANFASIHVYNFVKNSIETDKYKVSGLSMGALDSIPGEYLKYYKENRIDITEEDSNPSDSNWIKIKKIYRQLRDLGTFDIVHIHYVNNLYTIGIYLLRKNYKKIILTFWGSDFYRESALTRLRIAPVLRVADKITFITNKMKNDFFKKTIFHKRLDNRSYVLDYGNMMFPFIDSAKERIINNREECYSRFGLSIKKTVITIGYVGRPQMQQKQVVDALVAKVNNQVLKDSQIVIPAYGMKEEILDYIDKKLSDSQISYRIIPDFLGPDDVSLLRAITDIFIHPQTTDAFSSSMQECFYANTVIINGSWLNYKDVEEAGAYFLKFKDFKLLPDVLATVIENLDYHMGKSSINKKIMMNMCSWDRWRSEWQNLYI